MKTQMEFEAVDKLHFSGPTFKPIFISYCVLSITTQHDKVTVVLLIIRSGIKVLFYLKLREIGYFICCTKADCVLCMGTNCCLSFDLVAS